MAGQNPKSMRLSFGNYNAIVTCPTGASHLEKGQPCQDACMVTQSYYSGVPYTVLAIADGHGSEKYIRSDIGAHFAVEAAGDAAAELIVSLVSLRNEYPHDWHKQVEHEVNHRLGRSLVKRWRTRVIQHAIDHPDEGILPDSEASIGRYGSTAALAILYDKYLIAANLGDSAIYQVSCLKDNLKAREITKQAKEGVGLGTESLVDTGANYRWRFEVISLLPNPPSMVMLTTDGLLDSLENPEIIINELYNYTQRFGIEWLEGVLPDQLARWSDDGVGDDMGCIVFFSALSSAPVSGTDALENTLEDNQLNNFVSLQDEDALNIKKGENHDEDH